MKRLLDRMELRQRLFAYRCFVLQVMREAAEDSAMAAAYVIVVLALLAAWLFG